VESIQNIGGLHPEYRTYERQKCFVGHSREAEWHDDVLGACAEALPKFGLEPWYAADHFDPTKPLRDKVVELIANARYGIYDLSSWQDSRGEWHLPRNVFIELGMAITCMFAERGPSGVRWRKDADRCPEEATATMA